MAAFAPADVSPFWPAAPGFGVHETVTPLEYQFCAPLTSGPVCAETVYSLSAESVVTGDCVALGVGEGVGVTGAGVEVEIGVAVGGGVPPPEPPGGVTPVPPPPPHAASTASAAHAGSASEARKRLMALTVPANDAMMREAPRTVCVGQMTYTLGIAI